jgi:hypothetical protein
MQGATSRMEGGRGVCIHIRMYLFSDSLIARKLLKSMSIKQGQKYDSPESAREIPTFIAFHNLDVNEIKDPMDSFSVFPLLFPY